MTKVLAILPFSIAGAHIVRGLANGLSQVGCDVLIRDIRELDLTEIQEHNPDFVIGYDYAHFMLDSASRLVTSLNKPVVHYFADDPNGNFGHVGDLSLPDKLANSDGIVFCWDKSYLSSFKNQSFYLPLAVDAALYSGTSGNSQKYDISFVGRPLTVVRLEALAALIKKFGSSFNLFCYEKHFQTSVEEIAYLLTKKELETYKNSYRGFLKTEQELADTYKCSKIALNITMEQGVSSMNYRVFEVLASGAFLLTDFKSDIIEFFNEDEDLAFYRTKEELIEKVDFYLKNNQLREQIAQNGYKKVMNCHGFVHRAGEMLRVLKEDVKII